jgi:hypothetical protein
VTDDDSELEDAMQDLQGDATASAVSALANVLAGDPAISREAAYAQQLQATFDADPSAPPYPRGLVLDLALKTQPVTSLLADYGITVEEFKALIQHPVFRHDMLEMRDKLREEGFSFKVKAQAQAEQYLKEAWRLVHSPLTPANVRADLIKWTTKVAGLEPRNTDPAPGFNTPALAQLTNQLKNMPDGELEMKVMQVVLRNAKLPQPQEREITYEG